MSVALPQDARAPGLGENPAEIFSSPNRCVKILDI